MIARPCKLVPLVVLQSTILCLPGHAAPQTQSAPRGSAAFAPYHAAWQKDLLRSVAPVSSHDNRAVYRQGSGVFHLTIEWSTVSVLQVTVKKSTGYVSLDGAAVRALQQWRFRPASWRSLD